MKNSSVSVFFPYLNDWTSIGPLFLKTIETLKEITSEWEIIVVDDGSDEFSKNALNTIAKDLDSVRIIRHSENLGYGAAISSGIKASKGDLIFYTDGDGQYDPSELKHLLSELTDEIDVVNGYKKKRSDSFLRVFLGKVYRFTVGTLFNLPIRDVDCDFRLMRKSVFNKIKIESDGGAVCVELVKKIHDNGFKFKEIPVSHYSRSRGSSEFFNPARIFKLVCNIIALWYKLILKPDSRK